MNLKKSKRIKLLILHAFAHFSEELGPLFLPNPTTTIKVKKGLHQSNSQSNKNVTA